MYLVASVRPSVRLSVRYHSLPSAAKSNNYHYQYIKGDCLYVGNQ